MKKNNVKNDTIEDALINPYKKYYNLAITLLISISAVILYKFFG